MATLGTIRAFSALPIASPDKMPDATNWMNLVALAETAAVAGLSSKHLPTFI